MISRELHPLIVRYDHLIWHVGSTPLSVTWVAHFPFIPRQIPPGLKDVGNWRWLSDVISCPFEKNFFCKSLAVRKIAPSHWRFGSVKAKRETPSPCKKSMVDAQEGNASLIRGMPLRFESRFGIDPLYSHVLPVPKGCFR
jgi:hypothetical protein